MARGRKGTRPTKQAEKTLILFTELEMARVRVCGSRTALDPEVDAVCGIWANYRWSAQQEIEGEASNCLMKASIIRSWGCQDQEAGVFIKGIQSQRKRT